MALYCQILQADPTDAEAVRRCAVKTAAATERMTRLVRTLLKLAQVDAGGVPFAPALCPLDALAADAAEPLTARAAAEGKALSLEGPDVAALCDRAWTAEAIGNLIKNALDHTGPGGHIAVRWGAGPLGGWVTVQDDGPGIPPQDLPHLFKRFYRGSAPAGEGARPWPAVRESRARSAGRGFERRERAGRGQCVPRKSARPFKIVRESSPRCKLNLVG